MGEPLIKGPFVKELFNTQKLQELLKPLSDSEAKPILDYVISSLEAEIDSAFKQGYEKGYSKGYRSGRWF